MIWFGFASTLPAVLVGLGALMGGLFPLLALLSITVVVFFLDRMPSRIAPKAMTGLQPHSPAQSERGLLMALALTHFVLVPLVIWAVAGRDHLDLVHKILLVSAAGLWIGQVSHANAHELIHRSERGLRGLGRVLYASMLYGHHETAHLRIHHVHVATDLDPNSARLGEGFWRFCLRCSVSEYVERLRAENAARARSAVPKAWVSHPYVQHAAISLFTGVVIVSLSGVLGLVVWLFLSAFAAWQLMLSDYVQRYGLQRHTGPNGKREAMGHHHSWNAPTWYSQAMMLNAPLHSDHHMHPKRPYHALQSDRQSMPTLPQSLPVMAVIALVPPLWHRLMDRRAMR